MGINIIFWLIMLVWVLFGFVPISNAQTKSYGNTLLLIILFGLLGWKVFGPAIHG